jgi:hypothetical protein
MDWKQKVVVANPPKKAIAKPKPQSEQFQPPEIQQPEQPEALENLESLVDFPRDESIYGSGWSLAELMNEVVGR